jgi:hypothetical protein
MGPTLHLHTLRVPVTSRGLDLGPHLARVYAGNDLTGALGASSTLPVDLEFGEPDEVEERATFAETSLCGGPCSFLDGTFVCRAEAGPGLSAAYDLRTDRLRARLAPSYADDPQAVVLDLFRPLLQSFLLPLHGLKSLHGALLVRDGRGLFLAGSGGAGKSTAALALALSGWHLLSDDGPLFTLAGGRVRGLSSLDFLHVSPRTLSIFPDLERHVVGRVDRRGKLALPLAAFPGAESRRRPVEVDLWVELCRGPVAAPRAVPVARPEVLRRLVAAEALVFRSRVVRKADPRLREASAFVLELLAALAARASFYRIDYADGHLPRLAPLLEAL